MTASRFISDDTALAAADDTSAAPPPARITTDPEILARNVLMATTTADDMINAVHNRYSGDLATQGAALTRYLQAEQHSAKAGAVYIDPNEYTALRALAVPGDDAVRLILQRTPGMASDDKTVKQVSASLTASEDAPFAGPYSQANTTDPHAITDLFSRAPRMNPIIPASAWFADDLRIDGLTREQNIEFINRHEGWHEKDTQNKFIGLNPRTGEMQPKDITDVVNHPEAVKAFAISNRQECLADTGALGDMIRNGADPAIIDKAVAWREKTLDFTHMTGAALTALHQRIDAMGVDKFRAMDDAQARAFYNDIADHNSMPGNAVEPALRYLAGTAQQRADIETAAKTDPVQKAALDFVAKYPTPPATDAPHADAAPAQPTAADQAIARQLGNYHPKDILLDRAFSDSGKITPVTLAKAYGAMQDELRQDMDREPDNHLWQAEAIKLREVFIGTVPSLPYIDENAKRGVDILKVEPALNGIPAAPPATPKQPEGTASRVPALRTPAGAS